MIRSIECGIIPSSYPINKGIWKNIFVHNNISPKTNKFDASLEGSSCQILTEEKTIFQPPTTQIFRYYESAPINQMDVFILTIAFPREVTTQTSDFVKNDFWNFGK